MKCKEGKRQPFMIRFLGRNILKQNILIESRKQTKYKNIKTLFNSFRNKLHFCVIRKTNFQIFKFGIKNNLLSIFRIFQLFKSFQLFGLKKNPPFSCFFIYIGILIPINSFLEVLSFKPLLNPLRLGKKGAYKHIRMSLSEKESELTNSGILLHEKYHRLRQLRELITSKILLDRLTKKSSCHVLLNVELKSEFIKIKNSTSLRKTIELIE
mmetsp:Transcript_69265/g.144406  ORF Transcript_69265/g.144406 Transcript_69265/m.144406 type:complete len:211 (-) Transcript_69265:4283-4915(-)